MKYYELYQRLDYGYIKTKAEFQIYLRSSLSVYLPKGVTLMAITSGGSPKWTIDYYLTMDNISSDDYLFEKIELLFLKSIPVPRATDAAGFETAVKEQVSTDLLRLKSPYFTIVSNIYNDKKVLEGQVTNTIANEGDVVAI
jgi:hypothetical protein